MAAHALRHLIDAGAIGIRSVLTEAGNRSVHDARIDGAHLLVIHAEPIFHIRPIIFQHDVRFRRHAEEDRPPLVGFQVERQAALVAMQVLEVAAVAMAHVLAIVVRSFDLDDVRAPVGELTRSRGTRARAREIEDQQI